MRLRPRDPRDELRKAKHALADAEQERREMWGHTRASKKLRKDEEIAELKAKIERLREVVS